jgi:hypothetical protein
MMRRRRIANLGFTLIEAVIAMAVLVLVVVAVAAAVGVGVRTVGAGGAGDLLAGDHDLTALEQSLGRDTARAECVYDPPANLLTGVGAAYCGDSNHADSVNPAKPAWSTCASPLASLSLPGDAAVFFCAAWSEFWDASGTCHVALYYRHTPTGSSQMQIYRTEAANGTFVATKHLTTEDVTVSAAPGSQGDLKITLTGAPGARSPISSVYDYRPLGTIPTVQPGTDLC